MTSTTTTQYQRFDTVGTACSEEDRVILQPVVKRIPNRHNVYCPSKLEPKKEMSYKEFLSQYTRHPRGIRICFDETPSSDTILQRSNLITAYSIGLDCWYIVVLSNFENS